jgi:hypothetical protein
LGCGSDDGGTPSPNASGGAGGSVAQRGNSASATSDEDLESCRADLPAWTSARELTTNGGALFHFTIVDGRIYYAAGTEFYSDTFPADAPGDAETLLRSYPSVNYFVTPNYVGYGSGPVPMQQLTLVPRAGGVPLDRAIEAKAWATQGQYHAATDTIYGRVLGGDRFSYFTHQVTTGEEKIIETTSSRDVEGPTLLGDYLYATLEGEAGQPPALFRFALGGTEAEPVPVDVTSYVVFLKDSSSLYLREVVAGDTVNRYYRLPPLGGTAVSIDLDEEGLQGVFNTSRGLIFNTQLRPGQPVNVRLLAEGSVEPVPLWTTSFDCRSRGMLIDGDNLYVGLQPTARDWVVTIPLANLGL